MIDQSYIDKILDEVDIESVVSQYVKLTRKGHRLWACCPFHSEKTPSFHVDTAKNLWYCHGCGRGGNVITFVMEYEHVDFRTAIKKLLKEQFSIDLEEQEITPEEQERHKKVESMRIINMHLCNYFEEQLFSDTPEANKARQYMLSRWPEEYCRESHLGYAPKDAKAVERWALSKGFSLDLMKEMGILKENKDFGTTYSFYYNRLMIPIRDRYSHVIGFTGRSLDLYDLPKYLNSSNSAIYQKKESIFGIDVALRKAHRENKMYLVEGGTDVMKLQSVGIPNTIASLGGSWSEEQFLLLKKCRLQSATLCFIPDSDPPKAGEVFGPGFVTVMKAGELAMQCGFSVSVKEIPNDLQSEHPEKVDPDLYINKMADLQQLEEKEYVVWYLEKNLPHSATAEKKQKLISHVAELLTYIKDAATLDIYLDKLAKVTGKKTVWKNAVNNAKRRQQAERVKKSPDHEKAMEMMDEFGFYFEGNCYYGVSDDGEKVRWSNFRLRPLFHIKDDVRPLRLFEIKNSDPDNPAELIEFDMDDLTAVRAFRKKLLGTGNYDWKMGERELVKLQAYLAKDTPSACLIKQLGHQRQGFYAFANGVLNEETLEWIPIDDMGIVGLPGKGTFYLPALSKIYQSSTELFVNERKFFCGDDHPLTQRQYFVKVIGVFGDNAKVSLCFYVLSLFADVVRSSNISLPMLNLFGPIGSGKTQLARALMCLYYDDPRPVGISSSVPSLADAVASVSNALVHIDEYKNDIPLPKIEFLKNIYDAVGRTRMNMDLDKKREQAKVDSVVILSGQEIPAVDPALYSRVLHLVHEKNSFSNEERERFDDLMDVCKNVLSYITLQLLKNRQQFIKKWPDAYKKATMDMDHGIRNEKNIHERVRKNWTVIMAVYLASEDFVEFPFEYNELVSLCVNGVKHQNKMSSSVDEVARFWNFISAAFQMGKIRMDEAFKIRVKSKICLAGGGKIEYEHPRPVLMLRKQLILTTYAQMGRSMDEKVLPTESMIRYLQLSAEYIGTTNTPERFVKFISDGMPEFVNGKKKCYQDRPLCFDYERVSERYGVLFEPVLGDDEQDADEEVKSF